MKMQYNGWWVFSIFIQQGIWSNAKIPQMHNAESKRL